MYNFGVLILIWRINMRKFVKNKLKIVMKKTLLLSIILLISVGLFAGFVPGKDAQKVAKSHFYQGVNNIKQTNWEDLKLSCLIDPTVNNGYNFYVFNVNGDEGFIVVSSENKLQPILAYSYDGGFNNHDMHPGQQEMLKYYQDCIEFAAKNDMQPATKDANEWAELLNYNPNNGIKQKTTSPNLLQNINWNQDWPYNSQCPEDADGIHGHVPVGCVATAMLQVMKYYNWPESGEGSKYHSNWANGGYGNINISFANQTYDWYSIPNEASSYVNEELGKINYHAGVAVSMMYGPDGSGTFTDRVEIALKSYFKYSSSTKYVEKGNYSETEWKNIIKSQIDEGKPLVYSGNSSTTGHAWNCDGYEDDSFHMNWGWGGAGNGYYTLDNLTSSATVGGPENNFNQHQEMVMDIYPEGSYPNQCSRTTIATGIEGSFGDGSANEYYLDNQSCVYSIEPTCGSVVSVNFNDFDLGEGDELIAFDGDETSTTVLATFDSDNLPGTEMYTSTSGAMTLHFNTDGTSNGEGWNLDYKVKNCKSGIRLAESSGNFSDGSGVCEYSNSSFCSWYIEPENVNWITISFDEFDLVGYDYVKVFKNSSVSSNLVETFNADNIPTGALSINAELVVIQFFADSNDSADGWEISYTSSLSDIEENKFLSNFSIMPNPGNLNSNLQFSITNNSDAVITVTNLLGEVIATKEYSLNNGLHNFTLSEIVNTELEAGIYSVSVNANNQTQTQKLVVVE